jgi:hypothetical protein
MEKPAGGHLINPRIDWFYLLRHHVGQIKTSVCFFIINFRVDFKG